jgi:spoIIIJ-associated protein
VEWVETTGRTVEDAKEAALDELGVDESDAEFEVLEEARAGLFGRLRSEARVRARVRPTAPRAKEDRRDRRRRNRATGEDSGARPAEGTGGPNGAASAGTERGAGGAGPVAPAAETLSAASSNASPAEVAANSPTSPATATATATAETGGAAKGSPRTRARRRSGRGSASETRPPQDGAQKAQKNDGDEPDDSDQREGSDVEVALDEQGRVAEQFLRQLTAEFGLQASVEIVRPDDDTVDLQLRGSDLGLLIGPKGSTLLAIQDLTRTVVHHQTGAANGRIHVDVGGYRQKRSEALARFAQQVATTVKQSGTRTVLEPMSAADRKVVHDAITQIDGVSTVSEGEEPRRRVVVLPADR